MTDPTPDPLAEALLDLGPDFWPEDEDHRWCDANEGGHHFEAAAWRADLRAAIAAALAARGVHLVTVASLTRGLAQWGWLNGEATRNYTDDAAAILRSLREASDD